MSDEYFEHRENPLAWIRSRGRGMKTQAERSPLSCIMEVAFASRTDLLHQGLGLILQFPVGDAAAPGAVRKGWEAGLGNSQIWVPNGMC